MKQALIALAFFTVSLACFGQASFVLRSNVGKQDVLINGVIYSVDSIGLEIPTNIPDFDTLVFKSDYHNSGSQILCNFKPDTNYSLSLACCGSLDIIPTSKFKNDSLKYWNVDRDFDKIQNHLMDKPYISIRKESKSQDSVFAWHADAACETEYRVLNSELWHLGIPPKCYYWNNITTIVFFKRDETMKDHMRTDLEEFLGIENIVILTEVSFRLFDNERYVLIYDEKNKSARLEYE